MKKKILAGLFICFLCVFSISNIKAVDMPTVTFDGSSTLKYSEDVDSFGQAFNKIQSGESRTLDIKLVNDSNKSVDFFMNTEVLSSLEDKIGASGAGYKVSLKLMKEKEETYIFGSEKGALIGANENGLYDLNGALNDTYLITALEADESAILALTIEIDGVTSTNAYQGTSGEIQFDFSVTYKDTIVTNVIENVVTGDPTTVSIFIVLLSVAGGMIYVSSKRMKGVKS